MTSVPAGAAPEAAAVLAERTGVRTHDLAVVFGSGWVPAADALGRADVDLPVTDLPGFLPPSVEGHAGRVNRMIIPSTSTTAPIRTARKVIGSA